MATNNKINISDLDFDLIKTRLKEFMQGQEEFTDYDFEGSGLNVLMDILAYNTHYNAMYTNLAINEMFLDSASKRDSVVSIANNYGYLPISRRASKAIVNMSVPTAGVANPPATLSLPKFTGFSSYISGNEFSFYTLGENIGLLNSAGSQYVFSNIELYEGVPVTEKFTMYENTKITLGNYNIDTSTIKVTVQDLSESLNSSVYTYVENMISLTSTSKVYFVKEIEGGKYEIYFGKNNLGYQPPVGSVVTVEYLITNGAPANGVRIFNYNGETVLPSVPVFSIVSPSFGGSEAETVDEIKYNVSHKYKVQDRAVTAEDYIDIIKINYADIDSINCYGGESLTPPIYGKIFISIKPQSGPFLTPSEKNYLLESVIKPKQMLGVMPVILDPLYNQVEVDCTFYYDPNLTNKTSTQLEDLVRQSIMSYNDTYLQKFDGVLRYSRFIRNIDDTDKAIINNLTTLKVRRNVDVIFDKSVKYTIDLANSIYSSGVPEESILTNGFYINSTTVYYIDDDGVGNLRLFYIDPTSYEKIVVNSSLGTVDYVNGKIVVNNLYVSGIVESELQIIAKLQSNDIVSKNNQIVDINSSYLKVTSIAETSGITHRSASSRN